MYPSTQAFKESKYLIYSQWQNLFYTGSTIGGSLLLDCAMTKEEAEGMVAMYKQRAEDARTSLESIAKTKYIYIQNQAEWWDRV